MPTRPGVFSRTSTWVVAILVASLLGGIIPGYVSAMGDGYSKLMALPAALLLAFLVAYSRTSLLLLIVMLRGSTDNIFEESRFAIGGSQVGIGGLINAFAILIAILLIIETPKRFSSRLVKVWAPFLAVLCVSAVITPNRAEGVRLLLQLLSCGAVFVGAYYCVRNANDYRTCIWIIFWSSLLPMLAGYMELLSGGGYDYVEGRRIRGTFSHPNILAFYLTLIIAITFYISKSSVFALSHGKKFLLGLYMVVLLGLLMLTKTRSAWVATSAIFAGYALFFERRYFAYLILAGVAAMFVPGVGDRLLDVTQGTGNGISSREQLNSFAWRQSLWDSGISWMTPVHYLFGYGIESFRYFAPVFFKEGGGRNWGAHSIYVQIFFELGVAGVAAFVWMWAQLYRATKSIASFDRLTMFLMTFVAIQYLVTAASDNMLHYLSVNWYLWFILGAGTAYAAIHAAPDGARALPAAAPNAP